MSSPVEPAPQTEVPQSPAALEFWRSCQQLIYHLDNAPLPVIVWDHEFRVTRWNEQAERLFGWAAAEVVGRRWSDWGFLPPGEWEAVVAAAAERVRAGERAVVVTNRNLTKGGDVRLVEWRNSVLTDPAGNVASVLSFALDVTGRRDGADREALDRQFVEAQKWESLGVLAGGVAHDFNNILTVVLGSAGLARKSLPPGPAAGHLDHIEQACRRAAELCRQLLAYAGRGHAPAADADLNDLIRSSAALLEVPASRSARVRLDLAPDLPPVRADPAQVRQALVNLVMNAAEAVGEAGGEVVVGTAAVEVPAAPPAGYHLSPGPGRYVRLAVTDTGPGVSPEAQARLFDPFYTTKFPGRGLGLSAVLGIARSHGGAVRVDTAAGRGTTVEVLWPVADEPRAPAPDPPRACPPRRPDAKALVVDDEMFVREVIASTLEDLGYEPLVARGGAAALELFRQHRAEVRVAVLDVVMPGQTGDQLLDELRAIDPDLPAVLVSGYNERRVVRGRDGGRTLFLQKPFHPEELVVAVGRVTGGVVD